MSESCCGGAEDDGEPSRQTVDPVRKDPFDSGIDRRRLLKTSGAVGVTAALGGCLGDSGDDGEPTVLVFNTGDRTVSVIDSETDELLDSVFIDTTASFPANQYTTDADSSYDIAWLNVSGGVRGFDQNSMEERAFVETGYGPNYPNVTPDGEHLVIASGGTTNLEPDPDDPPNHEISRGRRRPGERLVRGGDRTDRDRLRRPL
jgi:TAT (twin-arginine translocation) pathway signal sequence.